ncbi:hypothetical protein AVEN_174608-1 [Araneus ventricosus]|uniref:Uncharacterized protein n=1 Tax=Araneus ventricosus TaxID=182803 RepID=A0A4Y2RX36_ARAVE|nr:hypothetical protein AVEN_174608-1 [Araneus ventricosus]
MTGTTPEPVIPSPSFRTTPAGGKFGPDGFNVHQARLHGSYSVESGLNLEPSGFEVETLPPGHRGPPVHRSTRGRNCSFCRRRKKNVSFEIFDTSSTRTALPVESGL